MTRLKPNLFIIGAMKAGTTYLRALLMCHPSIFMCEPKEPCYFVEPTQLSVLYPEAWRRGYWKGERRYLDLFRSSGTATMLGEASVFYTFAPMASGVAARLSRFDPSCRLIYIMRDPIDRTISHYWHNVRHFGEYRSPFDAIRHDRQYMAVSNYELQLREYFAHFETKQIMLLTFEEMTAKPDETTAKIFRWLQIADVPLPASPPQNVTPERFGGSIGAWRKLRRQNRYLRTAVDRVPRSIRQIGARMVTREVSPDAVDMSQIVEFLRPKQQAQTAALGRLLGRDFPEWTSLGPHRTAQPS
jgi:hypothetical protein